MSGASERAYTEIRRRLLKGDYVPGVRLNESDLSEVCGVSRTPVREASVSYTHLTLPTNREV